MKFSFTYYLASSVMLLIWSSCSLMFGHDCPDKVITQHHYLSDTEKTKLPYTGTDTLAFINTSGDTIIAVGKGRISSDDIVTTGDYECVTNRDYYEKAYVYFKSLSSDFGISTYIAQAYNDQKLYSHSLFVTFGKAYFNCPLSSLTAQKYNDTILLNGSIHKVLKIAGPDSSQLYYNHTEGILKCETGASETWVLLR